MKKGNVIIMVFVGLWLISSSLTGSSLKDPDIMGSPVNRDYYERLLKYRFLPTKPEMTDIELAQKLKPDLPLLSEVKSALEKKDNKAIEKSLGNYLSAKIPPIKVTPSGKPASNSADADRWLAETVEVKGKTYNIGAHGEKIDWWYSGLENPDSQPGFSNLAVWAYPLCMAYQETGDDRYVERFLIFLRDFYHRCRPPLNRPLTWGGGLPWSLGGPNRTSGHYLQWYYKVIGASSAVTDADRVMFLKTFYEHADAMYVFLEIHSPQNFEVGILREFINVPIIFPEFRDRDLWMNRICQRFMDNMRDAMLDDGGAWERHGYHFAFMDGYLNNYLRLRDAGFPLPDSFKQGIEKMYDWTMWMITPTLEWPLWGHGSMLQLKEIMQKGVNLFPSRSDFAYVTSFGEKGEPPSSVARVLPHSGFATMRSDWSKDALFLGLRYNSAHAGVGGHHDVMSFNIWAYGEPWMTNPGTTCNYDQPEYDDWCMQSISHNTIQINWRSHDILDNAGRVETWASRPDNGQGFTYLSSVSNAYESQNAEHRRAILFLRPGKEFKQGYWLMYDRIEFEDKPNELQWYPYDVQWLGHFQPTRLTVDPVSKAVATAEKDGKRFYLIPAEPETLRIEQNSGPILTRDDKGAKPPLHPNRAIGPYVSLRKNAIREYPIAYTVLLYPAKDKAKEPALETLSVMEGEKVVSSATAGGYRIIHDAGDDLIAMAKSSGLRRYGEKDNELVTDGETAYVRRINGRVVEAGLVRGESLIYNGKNLIMAGPDVPSVCVKYGKDMIEISARGRGEVAVPSGDAKGLTINGKALNISAENGTYKCAIGNYGKLILTKPLFSTKPSDVCKAAGVAYGWRARVEGKPETGFLGPKRSVVVKWNSSLPADSVIEYRIRGEKEWMRSINPEIRTEHYILLSHIKPGAEYEMRITGMTDDGRLGSIKTSMSSHLTRTVRE